MNVDIVNKTDALKGYKEGISKAFQELDKKGDPIDIVSVIEHVGRET